MPVFTKPKWNPFFCNLKIQNLKCSLSKDKTDKNQKVPIPSNNY